MIFAGNKRKRPSKRQVLAVAYAALIAVAAWSVWAGAPWSPGYRPGSVSPPQKSKDVVVVSQPEILVIINGSTTRTITTTLMRTTTVLEET